MSNPKKILVFQHVPHEHPGMIRDIADEQGVKLDVLELWKPYQVPDANRYSGLVIMGGPMGVYEDYPSKNDELAFIKEVLGKIPIIGFCLGSQLLAHALGAEVYPNIKDGKKVKEIGYYNVDLTDEGQGDPIFKGFTTPVKVLQWHGDAFDLPQGALLLATSPDCTNQAFHFGNNAYGMLFHNEFTPEMIQTQIETDRNWIHEGFEIDENQLLQQARDNAQLMRQQCNRLFTNFLNLTNFRNSP